MIVTGIYVLLYMCMYNDMYMYTYTPTLDNHTLLLLV